MSGTLIAAVETGGTKLLARVADLESGATVAEDRWETTTAKAAADDLCAFLSGLSSHGRLAAVGMAAFGPLVVEPSDPGYGTMLETPKPGWTGSNLRQAIAQQLGIPVAVDTDVNAAALAELATGAGRGVPTIAYVTVGTGIGAGLAAEGKSLKGALHPEAGHLRLSRVDGDHMHSVCPFHSDCAEGLASGPAVRRRLGDRPTLSEDPATANLVASYLGQLAAALVLMWSPHRIVWGGGIIKAVPLLDDIGLKLVETLGGYGVGRAIHEPGFCVHANLEDAGLEGAMVMARQLALEQVLPG